MRKRKPCVPIFQPRLIVGYSCSMVTKSRVLIMELAEFKDPNSSFSKAFIEFVSGLYAQECDRYFETVEQNLLITSMEHCKRVACIYESPRHLSRNWAVFERNIVFNRTKSISCTLNDGIVYEMFSTRKSFSSHSCPSPCLLHLGLINLHGTKTKDLTVKMTVVARMGRKSSYA